ncbi:MAG: cell wall-binding repeat-containing protein [Euzebya sp.]
MPFSSDTSTAVRVWVVLTAVVVVLAGSVPAARAGQGAPPTTDLTGYTDQASSQSPTGFAQGCLPAGGSPIPDPEVPAGDFVFVGGGWGHGAGMSQYGAQGAGRLGCSAEQILTTYFTGTSVQQAAMPAQIIIGLATAATSTRVTADAETLPWELCHYQTGTCTDLPVTQASGEVWTIDILADATYRITDSSGAVVFQGSDREHNLRARLSTTEQENRRASVSSTGHVYRWGVLQIDSVQSALSDAYITLEIPSMELYLRGLSEVPASWPAATLQAQAIAGRSYAVNRINRLGVRESCRCNLLATPADQNYEGYDYELADARLSGSWRTAVDATSSKVLTYGGAIAETFYSSSHGGHSESSRFVFGGDLPYVQPTDDSRWDLASSNPLRRWTMAISAEDLGRVAGVGTATDLNLLEPRGAAGRVGSPERGYGGVQVTGTSGTVVLSGDDVRRGLGLRSTLFNVRVANPGPGPQPQPEPEPEPEAPDLLQRAAGDDRIATAIQVSELGWTSSQDAIIAGADRFADALAGVKLAASLEAPLLLTDSGSLPQTVVSELSRLNVQTVWLLGGQEAISSDVRGDLADLGITTRRLSGATRYETAGAIATASTSAADEVTVALGEDWPDAVSASSLAALVDGPPTLLVQRDRVPDATVQAIRDLGVTRVNVIGGTAVITDQVVQALQDLGLSVSRLAGVNRFDTSTIVATQALDRRPGQVALVAASGSGFPDALAAGALAARLGGVLVLTPTASLSESPSLRDFVSAQSTRLDGGVVVGGVNVISTTVENQLESLLAGG